MKTENVYRSTNLKSRKSAFSQVEKVAQIDEDRDEAFRLKIGDDVGQIDEDREEAFRLKIGDDVGQIDEDREEALRLKLRCKEGIVENDSIRTVQDQSHLGQLGSGEDSNNSGADRTLKADTVIDATMPADRRPSSRSILEAACELNSATEDTPSELALIDPVKVVDVVEVERQWRFRCMVRFVIVALLASALGVGLYFQHIISCSD